MDELSFPQFSLFEPLLDGLPNPVLPRGVVEGFNPGRVFVDDRSQPRAGLVWLACGYLYLAGDPARVDPAGLENLLNGDLAPAWRAGGETGYILVPGTPGWVGCLEGLLGEQPHAHIFRRAFTFNPEGFAALADWPERIPDGFELRRVDSALVERLGGLGTWASPADFLARGLGFVILRGDTIASACTSVFGCSSGLEIDVHTEEAFRGQGLATLTVAAFIDTCLMSGRLPNWECFWDNAPSAALAGKLGFKMKEDYPVVYWEPEAQG